MIFKDINSLNYEASIIRFFYKIPLDDITRLLDPKSASPTIKKIFTQCFNSCTPYIPLAINSSGILNEFPSHKDVTLIKKLFLNQCVIHSLITARLLATNNTSTIVESNKLAEAYIPYIASNDQILRAGYFSLLNNSKLDDISDIDYSSKHDTYIKKKDYAFYSSLMKRFLPDHQDSKSILLNICSADVSSFIISDENIQSLITLIKNFTTNKERKLHNLKSSYSKFSNHIYQSQVAINEYTKKQYNDIDKILFTYQIEDIFHLNLYTHILSSTNLFSSLQNSFLERNKFSFNTTDKPYLQYVTEFLNATLIPIPLYATAFFNYAMSSLPKFNSKGTTYLDSLMLTHMAMAKFPTKGNINADDCFNEWKKRISNFFNILSNLYIPLLEKTFFITLYNLYEQDFIKIVDVLYNYISVHKQEFYLNTNNLFINSPAEALKTITSKKPSLKNTPTKNTNKSSITNYYHPCDVLSDDSSLHKVLIQKIYIDKDYSKTYNESLYNLALSATTSLLSTDTPDDFAHSKLRDLINHQLYDITTYFGNR